MKILARTLLVTGLLFVTEGIVPACVCIDLSNSTPEGIRKKYTDEADWASVIFSGEVISVDMLEVKFKVDRVWKGEDKKEITMSTGVRKNEDGTVSFTSCDYDFAQGEKYIVYARVVKDYLQTSQCSGTRLFKNAEGRLDFLDELQRKDKQKKD
ncbi:MAG: hypothetical protein L0220_12845 [Acidobacteria bacterium]|nr:hypothetical protein [Acidobacteriota bacterium]